MNEIILCKTYLRLDPESNFITLNLKIPRDSLVLRGLATTLEIEVVQRELEKILMGDNKKDNQFTIINLKPEVNSNWIVQFSNELEAQSAFHSLKGKIFLNGDKPIKPELKTNTLFRASNFSNMHNKKAPALPP